MMSKLMGCKLHRFVCAVPEVSRVQVSIRRRQRSDRGIEASAAYRGNASPSASHFWDSQDNATIVLNVYTGRTRSRDDIISHLVDIAAGVAAGKVVGEHVPGCRGLTVGCFFPEPIK